MIHLIFVTKYRKKDRNNLKLHRKIAPKWGRSFLIKSVKLDPFAECDAILKILIYLVNPHLPCGRWHASGTIGITLPDFNPHLPCGRWLLLSAMAISASDFNPHLPCGRWRSGRIDRRCRDCTFQSTPSLRKVTTPLADICNCRRISIHTFLAEGDEDQYRICKRLRISIHTFLAEGDTVSENTGYVITSRVISIHTFLAEGDWRRWRRYGSAKDFNPHLPCGRWRLLPIWPPDISNFNPHLPCGRWRRSCRKRELS